MLRCALLTLLALAAFGPAVAAGEHGRLHHVHLNVADIGKTEAFYGRYFSAVPILWADKTPAMMAERTFIFLNPVPAPIASSNLTGLIHLGWGRVDGPGEFEWLKSQGIEFYTPLTKFLSGHYMYLFGPDHEVIEVWTDERVSRLNHIHLLSPDPKASAEWFAKVTNPERPPKHGGQPVSTSSLSYGDVTVHILPDIPLLRPKERTGAMKPTDGANIDHIAFAFRDLDAAYRRVKAAGVPIVRPIAVDKTYGVTSFYVRSPEGVLVELVKAKSLPEAAWQ